MLSGMILCMVTNKFGYNEWILVSISLDVL